MKRLNTANLIAYTLLSLSTTTSLWKLSSIICILNSAWTVYPQLILY